MNVLKLLLVEDSEDDALLLLRNLKKGGFEPEYTRVWSDKAVRQALKNNDLDIIISDYAMPGFTGMEALDIYKESGLEIPFIIVSGTIGEDVAVETMRHGAHDYFIKGNYDRLVPAIKRELKDADLRIKAKQTQKVLRESEEKFRTIFENIQDVYYESTIDGIIIEISPSIFKLLKYTREELINKSLSNLYLNIDNREKLIEQLKKHDSLSDFEITLVDKDGDLHYCSISSTLKKIEGSNKMKLCGTIRDLTDRKIDEQDIIMAKEQAEESDRLKSSFLATMSHEIRTPLNAVIGFSALIKDTESIDRIHNFAETINKSGYHLLSIIEDVFDMSILESEKTVSIKKETVKEHEKETFDWAGKIILIVEDEETNYKFIKIVLEPTRAEIIWAKNASECIKISKNNENIDLILMDIQLPEMSGHEATKIIRGFNSDIKIIAQTAHALDEDKDKALKSGCNEYITKPIDRLFLLQKIDKLLAN